MVESTILWCSCTFVMFGTAQEREIPPLAPSIIFDNGKMAFSDKFGITISVGMRMFGDWLSRRFRPNSLAV